VGDLDQVLAATLLRLFFFFGLLVFGLFVLRLIFLRSVGLFVLRFVSATIAVFLGLSRTASRLPTTATPPAALRKSLRRESFITTSHDCGHIHVNVFSNTEIVR